jgi:AcrR family transcriptional regulator
MATPKRKHKIRDYEATRRKLLETVGDILRDTGYAGLKTNNIARRAGKDKSLIRYYFQSLANLQKSYIKENDYWLNFFEDFRIPENPGRQELEALFVDLMKANFGFFRDNIEMQKIILWQISESNPLMRSVSDSREREGGKLLEMTDAFFRDSGTNFRALVALILGGTYYLVLHAETNKSTVCGIDINLEKDREAILTCIEQLLRLAWQQPRG